MRASLCGDCMKFNTDRCPNLGKVKIDTWQMMLLAFCDESESTREIVEGKGLCCKKCGRKIPSDKVGCKCTYFGEYEHLR